MKSVEKASAFINLWRKQVHFPSVKENGNMLYAFNVKNSTLYQGYISHCLEL